MDAGPPAPGPPSEPTPTPRPTLTRRLRRVLFGPARDLTDRSVFRHLSVVAVLAWVGLGADGLSSSAYGPEEAFRTLGSHRYLAVGLAVLMALTIAIIAACYSRIIDRFPHGGGGYVVATALLGPRAGLVSGAALLVDYVLTITVSIAAAGDACWSLLPPEWHGAKLAVEVGCIAALTLLNLRGVKESILVLAPIFFVFLATHAVLIGGGILAHAGRLPETTRDLATGFREGVSTLGLGGMAVLFLHAYSLGGGTYTGIEAVSNAVPIMREPRVQTAKHTMLYLAVSLAATASGLILCYLLWDVAFTPGRTLNAVLTEQVAGELGLGSLFVWITLAAEGALLVVAAQAGMIDGPRVLANMAIDRWVPRRFATLSEQLTIRDGVRLMGLAAIAALLYTGGDVRVIVVMYSINVFATFLLSMTGMAAALWRERGTGKPWRRPFALFATGTAFCGTILTITVVEKFREGGWVTLAVTGGVIAACAFMRRHYRALDRTLAALFARLEHAPLSDAPPPIPLDPTRPAALVLVGGYSGLGIHTTLAIPRMFPGQFRNVVFASVGVVDSSAWKGEDTVAQLRARVDADLARYVALGQRMGLPAVSRSAIGTDVVHELEGLCLAVAREFPRLTVFAGQLVFPQDRWLQRLLHNETVFALQRRLQQAGIVLVIVPARLPGVGKVR